MTPPLEAQEKPDISLQANSPKVGQQPNEKAVRTEEQEERNEIGAQNGEITHNGGSGVATTSDAASSVLETKEGEAGDVESGAKANNNTHEMPKEPAEEQVEKPDHASRPNSSTNVDEASLEQSPPAPPPPPKDERFLVNAPGSQPSKAPGRMIIPETAQRESMEMASNSLDAIAKGDEAGTADDRSEIQSIMEQFEDGMGGLGEDEIMSPRLEKAGPLLSSPPVFPPRRSSLEPISSEENLNKFRSSQSGASLSVDSHPRRSSSLQPVPAPSLSDHAASSEKLPSPQSSASLHKPPPPSPDPEPDLPFDFHRFLEQLRHRTADPVAKFLRSFLLEFGKKQWMVHEQVKIISDFLEFISKKMAQCEVWRTVSDPEFDNAREGMEKLVMNRLYNQCFSPAIPAPEPVADGKGRRKSAQVTMGPGRRGQHQEDVERDEVLAQKVRIYGWVKEEHLDIPAVGDKGRKFLKLAQQELSKVNSYRAPRDKVICILNSCKVIFGMLRSAQSDQSADSFVPLLIYTVLQANPEHLVSNVQYILRFRNQDKLGGEAGYYISSLMGAIQFIEALDRTSLTVSDADFEKHVEAAVSAIAERHSAEEKRPMLDPGPASSRQLQPSAQIISEKSSLSRPEVTPRNSLDAERALPNRSPARRTVFRSEVSGSNDSEEDTAVAGLLRTIQRPLSTIGRIFSDDGDANTASSQYPSRAPATPQPPRRISPAAQPGPAPAPEVGNEPTVSTQRQAHPSPKRMSAEDAAALQASAEAEQARKLQAKEHQVVVETLQGMFPGLDRDVIDDVVTMKEGRVGLAVDACLALSS